MDCGHFWAPCGSPFA